MAVQYRKLTENDLETFIEMRIRQLRDEGVCRQVCKFMRYENVRSAEFVSRPNRFVAHIIIDGKEQKAHK